jgi:hypothetical protein
VKIYLNLSLAFGLTTTLLAAAPAHDAQFWRSIQAHDFAVPAGEAVDPLALELVDLAAETDPALRDDCGYEILAAWVYKKNLVSVDQLETIRQKLVSGMTFHIGESGNPTIFRRSFSALYMSLVAAQDLRKPFLSSAAFQETLDAALKCYSAEKDLRGYLPDMGWAHATAHVADLLKFLARNPQLTSGDQQRIVDGIIQRCRTVPSVFVWGEDARIAAALLSIINRKDFDASVFENWFKSVTDENKQLWKAPKLNPALYIQVRTQANVLAQLGAKVAPKDPKEVPMSFRNSLNAAVAELN